MPLLLYLICKVLSYLAAFAVASVSKLSRAGGADARKGVSYSPRLKIEYAIPTDVFFKALLWIFFFFTF